MSMKAKTNFLRCIDYLSFTKDRIANSSSCTTTELSKLLTACLTTIKPHVIRYCETVYETSNKTWFWSIKNSGEVFSKLTCRAFRVTSLSTYDFSTLYTKLPHNVIKERILDLTEWTFKITGSMVHFLWPVMTESFFFSLPLTEVDIHFSHVRMYSTPYPIRWIILILDLEPSYTDKLLESRWVQMAPLSWLIYFYTVTKEISWILLTKTIKLMLSRLLIRLLGTSMTFNIDNPYFEGMINQIYPPELQLNKADTTDTEAPFLDLHLSVANGFVSSKIYDKRDDFDLDIKKFSVFGW